jgi:hypothetical protein
MMRTVTGLAEFVICNSPSSLNIISTSSFKYFLPESAPDLCAPHPLVLVRLSL